MTYHFHQYLTMFTFTLGHDMPFPFFIGNGIQYAATDIPFPWNGIHPDTCKPATTPA